jgi:hypothetical protein
MEMAISGFIALNPNERSTDGAQSTAHYLQRAPRFLSTLQCCCKELRETLPCSMLESSCNRIGMVTEAMCTCVGVMESSPRLVLSAGQTALPVVTSKMNFPSPWMHLNRFLKHDLRVLLPVDRHSPPTRSTHFHVQLEYL